MDNVTIVKGDGSTYQTTAEWARRNAKLLAKHNQTVKVEVATEEETPGPVGEEPTEKKNENQEEDNQ